MTRWMLVAGLVGPLMMAAACTDDPVSTGGEYVLRPDLNNGAPVEQPEAPVITDLRLAIVGEATRAAYFQEALNLEVDLTWIETGVAAGEETVTFEIVSQPQGDQSSLSTRQALTSARGRASVSLRPGTSAGQIVVRASHPRAQSVDFTLNIGPVPTGALRVRTTQPALPVVTLKDVDVRIYPHNVMNCAMFWPLSPQDAPQAIRRNARVTDVAVFTDLNVRPLYTVTVIAHGERDQRLAGGCLEVSDLLPNGFKDVTIPLEIIPIEPTGRYDVTSYWDMTQAVASTGPFGSTITQVFASLDNPGQALYTLILDQVLRNVTPDTALIIESGLMLLGLDVEIQTRINDAIAANNTAANVLRAARDLRDSVSNLKVDSILTIGKFSAADGELFGRDEWYGLKVYWRANCDANSPADCGERRIGVGAGSDVGIAGAEWTGRLIDYNHLIIDAHPMALRYGRIILEVLNEVILPGMTDGQAHSLSEAFAYWIGCDSIGESLANSLPLDATTIAGFCQVAVTAGFGMVDQYVLGLDTPADYSIAGEGWMFDTSSDGKADLIEDGRYTGTISAQGANGQAIAPISATWTGRRLPDGP